MHIDKSPKYYIKTFGCQQNVADSERIASALEARGMKPSRTMKHADHIVINTCMIRAAAEHRVYGLVHNLAKLKVKNQKLKVVVTGCMVGMAARDKTGKFLQILKKRMPAVDEFLPIEEVGFDHAPLRSGGNHAWVPISNGCNNFCTFCVVPFTRGREVSRPFADIIAEVNDLVERGYDSVTLLGMNVNSYGADLVVGEDNIQVMRDLPGKTYFENKTHTSHKTNKTYTLPDGKKVEPIYAKHLGRLRIPTLFPYLLQTIAHIDGLRSIDFMTSNPWDFSDELIDVIAKNKNISRYIHLPVQAGSNEVLRRMNRWYTKEQYLDLLKKIRAKVSGVQFGTDIIVGFCGETDEEFNETIDLAKKAQFGKAYIAMYSDRPLTSAHKVYHDEVPHAQKKKRWEILDEIINKTNLKKGTYPMDQYRLVASN